MSCAFVTRAKKNRHTICHQLTSNEYFFVIVLHDERIHFKITPQLVRSATTIYVDKNTANPRRSLYKESDSNFSYDLVVQSLVGVEHDDVTVPWMARVENMYRSASRYEAKVQPEQDSRRLALILKMGGDKELYCQLTVEVRHVSASNLSKRDLKKFTMKSVGVNVIMIVN